jgi:hypothetical protein
MDRRRFLQISVAGAAAISIPMVHCGNKFNDALSLPGMLSNICDDSTIRELGRSYLQKFPAEKNSAKLSKLLLINKDGKDVAASSDTEALVSLLEQKIHEDYKSSKIIVLKGWVLSITEARQCALYSLNKA